MHEAIDMALEEAKDQMEKALERLAGELRKVRAGKAHPSMLEGVKLDYYGTLTPISQVANVNTTDARTIIVQPWEKTMLDDIAAGIINANLGLNPMNNGEVLRINVPPLTEERRIELSKRASGESVERSAKKRKRVDERVGDKQRTTRGESEAVEKRNRELSREDARKLLGGGYRACERHG